MRTSPIKNFRYLIPIIHLFEIHQFYRCTRYYHTIISLVTNPVKLLIEHLHMFHRCIFRSMTCRFQKINFYLQWRIRQQPYQVRLGRYFQWHQIKNNNTQRTYILRRRP